MKTWTRVFSTLVLSILILGVLHAQEQQLPPRQIITPKAYPVSVTNLGATINSSDDDFAPYVLGNGRIMYFTSNRDGDQNVYRALLSGGNWEQATNIGTVLNTSLNDGGTAITPDGHWMVYTGCDRDDTKGDCDLYVAEYVGGSWGNIQNLASVNSPSWDSQPALSADGLLLFFASDRPGGFGGVDIWMTRRTFGGVWSTPTNLGPNVNTAYDDESPFIAQDNKTLYFSSDGHPGAGGFDLYMSTMSPEGFTRPENLGSPINTASDELFFTTQIGTDNVYFASNRSGGEGDLDLFVGVPNPLPPSAVTAVMGTVSDSKTNTPIGATLTVRDIATDDVVSSFHSDDMDGNYVVVLQPGRTFVITAEAPGYLFYSDRFDVPKNASNSTVRKDIRMTREIVRLLVYFDFDKATLQKESFVDLNRAAQWLKDNPKIRVELAGHTDNVGARDYNKRLSDDRAKSVMEYLVQKGIPASRLSARGYGMDEPVDTNDTEEGRAQNRRVEFRVK